MATETATAIMLAIGIINIVSCYGAAMATFLFGQRLEVNSTMPWMLLQLSYGTMPWFGLWDDLVWTSKYSNPTMNGFSSFFSVMTMCFLVSAAFIDN